MPRMTLAFKLPEEAEEMKLAMNGARLEYNMDEFDNFLRSKIKYENLTTQEYEIYEAIRTKFWECRNQD